MFPNRPDFEAMVAGAVTGILIHDAGTKNILWANPTACRLLGCSVAELRPLKAHHMSAQEWQYRRAVGVGWLQSAVVRGQSRRHWKYRSTDGTEFLTDACATLLPFVDGPVVMVEFRDIATHEDLRLELDWVSNSLQRLMTHTSAGIVVLAEDNRVDDISPLAAQLFRRTTAEVLGVDLHDLGRCEPRLDTEQVLDKLRHGEGPVSLTLEVSKDNAEPAWLAGELEVVTHDGMRSRVLTVRDVTDRVQWERRAAYQEANMQHLSRHHAMGDMAMILAHELGQPLAASRNYVSGLKARLHNGSTGAPEALSYGLDGIERQLSRAADIVASVKRYVSRIERTMMPMNLNDTVEESLYFVRLRAAEVGVLVTAKLSGDVLPVQGESVLIGQVVINLCVNAIDEIVLPSTEVKELLVETGEVDGAACVFVRDHGRGMAVSTVDRLALGAFSAKQDGAGIGLIISEQIVERHGGNIQYSANTPRGTEVRIALPIAR
jgi:two-component system sensor kinase FixL